jgi:TPR repeat protein
MARVEAGAHDVVELGAGSGAPESLFELGLMYCTGRDVQPDLVAAHMWFNLAAIRGNVEAKRYRMEIAREMSKAEIAEAQRLAREWLARN